MYKKRRLAQPVYRCYFDSRSLWHGGQNNISHRRRLVKTL